MRRDEKTSINKSDLRKRTHERDLHPRTAQHHTIRRMPGRYQQALVMPHRLPPGLPPGLDGMQITMPPSPPMALPPDYSHQTHPRFERARQPVRPPAHQACTAPHSSEPFWGSAGFKIVSEYRTRKCLINMTGLRRMCDVVNLSTGKPHACANKHGTPGETAEIDYSHGTSCTRAGCPYRHGADQSP